MIIKFNKYKILLNIDKYTKNMFTNSMNTIHINKLKTIERI